MPALGGFDARFPQAARCTQAKVVSSTCPFRLSRLVAEEFVCLRASRPCHVLVDPIHVVHPVAAAVHVNRRSVVTPCPPK